MCSNIIKMEYCKKCHKRMVKVLATMTDIRSRYLCDGEALLKVEEGTAGYFRVAKMVGIASKKRRRKLLGGY